MVPEHEIPNEEQDTVGRRGLANTRVRVNGPAPKLQKHRVEAGVMAFRFFCSIFGNYAARKVSNLVARPENCLRETSPDDSSANNRDGRRGRRELPVDDSLLSSDAHLRRRLFPAVDRRGSCSWICTCVALLLSGPCIRSQCLN